ncbi:MAG: YidC/Oxa1 family membrane protein insertase [Acidimicrobiia bacterium]|jgi:YidC/Oxa1 family membrane protein insertase
MGIFQFLEQLLGRGLAFYFDIVPSYGVSIILLTLTVNLILFPLTLKQTRATRAFQSIQPEVRRIQKELKESPEEMQRELMRVQREAGATPGGCLLPLLVQFPIWLALFRTLQDPLGANMSFSPVPSESALASAIAGGQTVFLGMELGTSPSQAFSQSALLALPYLAMMLLMVVSQYFQQWHAMRGQGTPAAGANKQQQQTQQAITRIMPLFIGFISWNFPAGLVLYWTTSNLFRLVQQVVIFKIDGRPQLPAASEPEPEAANGAQPAPKPQKNTSNRRRRRRRK